MTYIYTHFIYKYTPRAHTLVIFATSQSWTPVTLTWLGLRRLAFPAGGCLSFQSYVWRPVLPLLISSCPTGFALTLIYLGLPEACLSHNLLTSWGHRPSISSINWWNSCFWWLGNELKSIVNFEFHRKDIACSSTRPCTSSRILWRRQQTRATAKFWERATKYIKVLWNSGKVHAMESYAAWFPSRIDVDSRKLATFCIQIAHSCPLLPHINSTLVHEILSSHADTLPSHEPCPYMNSRWDDEMSISISEYQVALPLEALNHAESLCW